MGYVYVLEFPNGKRYVGQSKEPENRWKKGYGSSVGKAINFFGMDSVTKYKWEVPDSQMDDIERFLILLYKSFEPEFGYNSQSGGKNGFIVNDVVKTNLSKSHSGRKHTDETKSKISRANKGKHSSIKGRKFTDEHKRRISESNKGTKPWNGKGCSDETRKKMSEAQRLRWAKIKEGTVP